MARLTVMCIAALFTVLSGFAGPIETKGSARLQEIVILSPSSGSTIYVDPSLGGIVLPILADTDAASQPA